MTAGALAVVIELAFYFGMAIGALICAVIWWSTSAPSASDSKPVLADQMNKDEP